MDGEIQIIPYGNSMKIDCDMSANSTLWKAIMPDGTLVEPGTAGTLKVDGTSASNLAGRINTSVTVQTTDSNNIGNQFKSLVAADGVNIPKLLVAMGLFPEESATYGGDYFWARNNGERLPFRGSAFDISSYSGASALLLNRVRSNSSGGIGFRSAFYE